MVLEIVKKQFNCLNINITKPFIEAITEAKAIYEKGGEENENLRIVNKLGYHLHCTFTSKKDGKMLPIDVGSKVGDWTKFWGLKSSKK